MKKNLPSLRICMFGKTVITYGNKPPSLTVENQKNRCIPCISWSAAIFAVVTKYSILFPSFAFFLNSSHFAFG